jgi:hypothetical protein
MTMVAQGKLYPKWTESVQLVKNDPNELTTVLVKLFLELVGQPL